MKRRAFLKLSGAALIVAALPAVPALAKNQPEQPIFNEEYKYNDIFYGDNTETFSGLSPETWSYRGWEVKYKYSDEEFETYEALKDEQYIRCDVESDFIDFRVENGHGTLQECVNEELDAYIEEADIQLKQANNSVFMVSYSGDGTHKIGVKS